MDTLSTEFPTILAYLSQVIAKQYVIEQSKRKPMCMHRIRQKIHFCLKNWGATVIQSSLQNKGTYFHKLRRWNTSTEKM